MDFSSVIFSKKKRKERKKKTKRKSTIGFNTLKIQQQKKKRKEIGSNRCLNFKRGRRDFGERRRPLCDPFRRAVFRYAARLPLRVGERAR
jgi:hypothetical protein